MEIFRSGFITIVGRPNSGKSTLINQILKQKVAIISDKPQTTRNRIQAVYTTDHSQLIFIDTPGIHKPKSRLGEYMNEVAYQAVRHVDVVLFMLSAHEPLGKGDRYILKQLEGTKAPVFLILNKIDLIPKLEILPLIDRYKEEFPFAEIVPISALTGDGVDELLETIIRYLPEGPKYYPDHVVTDHPESFIISELIREKVLLLTREEIPHSVAVGIDQLSKREDSEIVDIQATIIVERQSQKRILIGKGGRMMKQIGTLARQEIEQLLGSKVYLELWVKVIKDWRNKQQVLAEYGYRPTE